MVNEKQLFIAYSSEEQLFVRLHRKWRSFLGRKKIIPIGSRRKIKSVPQRIGLRTRNAAIVDSVERCSGNIDDERQHLELTSNDHFNKQQQQRSDEESDHPTKLTSHPSSMMMINQTNSNKKSPSEMISNTKVSTCTTGSDAEMHTAEQNESEVSGGVELDDQATCTCDSHFGKVLLDQFYPISTEKLFELLFSNVPWFAVLEKYLKNSERSKQLSPVSGYNASAWAIERPMVSTRTVTYTMALNHTIGPKSTFVTENQEWTKFENCSEGGFIVRKEIKNAGIPYADSFNVQCTYCVAHAGVAHTRLRVHAGIYYTSNIWGFIKGFIEKSTQNGLECHYNALNDALSAYCSNICLPMVVDDNDDGGDRDKRAAITNPTDNTHHLITGNNSPNTKKAIAQTYGKDKSFRSSCTKQRTNQKTSQWSYWNNDSFSWDLVGSLKSRDVGTQTMCNWNSCGSFRYNILVLALLFMLIVLQFFILFRISSIADSSSSALRMLNATDRSNDLLSVDAYKHLSPSGNDAILTEL